jgi:hypothetical protein
MLAWLVDAYLLSSIRILLFLFCEECAGFRHPQVLPMDTYYLQQRRDGAAGPFHLHTLFSHN